MHTPGVAAEGAARGSPVPAPALGCRRSQRGELCSGTLSVTDFNLVLDLILIAFPKRD